MKVINKEFSDESKKHTSTGEWRQPTFGFASRLNLSKSPIDDSYTDTPADSSQVPRTLDKDLLKKQLKEKERVIYRRCAEAQEEISQMNAEFDFLDSKLTSIVHLTLESIKQQYYEILNRKSEVLEKFRKTSLIEHKVLAKSEGASNDSDISHMGDNVRREQRLLEDLSFNTVSNKIGSLLTTSLIPESIAESIRRFLQDSEQLPVLQRTNDKLETIFKQSEVILEKAILNQRSNLILSKSPEKFINLKEPMLNYHNMRHKRVQSSDRFNFKAISTTNIEGRKPMNNLSKEIKDAGPREKAQVEPQSSGKRKEILLKKVFDKILESNDVNLVSANMISNRQDLNRKSLNGLFKTSVQNNISFSKRKVDSHESSAVSSKLQQRGVDSKHDSHSKVNRLNPFSGKKVDQPSPDLQLKENIRSQAKSTLANNLSSFRT